jgi:hypothetical protein
LKGKVEGQVEEGKIKIGPRSFCGPICKSAFFAKVLDLKAHAGKANGKLGHGKLFLYLAFFMSVIFLSLTSLIYVS